jgi:hypothetical protein
MSDPDLKERQSRLSESKRALLESRLRRRPAAAATAPAIPRHESGAHAPATANQQGMWDDLKSPRGRPSVSARVRAVRFLGELDLGVFERALREMVRRHEPLRTRFEEDGGRLSQVVTDGEFSLPVEDLTAAAGEESEQTALRVAHEELLRPFELTRGPLLRVRLLRFGPQDHVALFALHHIIHDARSVDIFTRELTALYNAFAAGGTSPLAELPLSFGDYAAWERRRLEGDEGERLLSYWRERLAGRPAELRLSSDRPRPAAETYRGGRVERRLPRCEADRLTELGRGVGATLFMKLLAAFKLLLRSYSSQDDIVLGSPVAQRTSVDVEGLIGFFQNVIILRTDISGDPTFAELLARVRETTLGAFAHQELPYMSLLQSLHPERYTDHTALYNVVFAHQSAGPAPPREAAELPGLSLIPLEVESDEAKFDLMLTTVESPRGLTLRLDYKTDLFKPETADAMLSAYVRLLERLDLTLRLSELTAAES